MSLTVNLSARYKQLGAMEGIHEAVIDALDLRRQGRPDRSISLNSLASHLSTRYYNRQGVMEDLHVAIVLDREPRPSTARIP